MPRGPGRPSLERTGASRADLPVPRYLPAPGGPNRPELQKPGIEDGGEMEESRREDAPKFLKSWEVGNLCSAASASELGFLGSNLGLGQVLSPVSSSRNWGQKLL